MGALQRFEQRLEGLVSGAFAKAFKADVQPVEIASALQRELDDRAAIVSRGSTLVPNSFIVELSPHDYERLSMYAQTLSEELVAVVREHAKEQRYELRGSVEVSFIQVDALQVGMHRVRSSVIAEVSAVGSAGSGAAASGHDEAPAGAATQVAENPGPGPAHPWLEVHGRRHPLDRPVTVLGRGAEVDLRVDDAGVSRRHAEIRAGDPALLVDLGSTNGTLLDGEPTDRGPLYDGSRIGLGATTLVFRLPSA